MKIFTLGIGLLILGFSNFTVKPNDIDKINRIIYTNDFVVSIERLDLGYFDNRQFYIFENTDSTLMVTHGHLVFNWQDTTLDHTVLKIEILDSLNSYLKEMKLFEIEHPNKFRRKFNKSGTWDIINVQNEKDTVMIYDVSHKAITEIHRMIKNNVK